MMKYEIGSRIRNYRHAAGMSQKELAKKLGVSNSRVSNWEQGVNRPDTDMLVKLCDALSVTPSELLGVVLVSDDYSSEEHELILAYRQNPGMQKAVRTLLGLPE